MDAPLQENLTPAQAEDTVRWLIHETRDVFMRALPAEYERSNHNPAYYPDLNVATLDGYCGFAQSFIDLTLTDHHIVSKPFALQTLPGKGFGHVALTTEMDTSEGKKTFLLDPTFKQFCKGEEGSPGQILANMPDGEHMLNALVKDGYVELTPQRAMSYAAAFNKGIPPFASEKDAMAFFANPPESDMNRWFKRERFQRFGKLMDAPKPA